MNYYNQYNQPQNYYQPVVQPSPVFEDPADPGYIEKKRLRRAGNSIGGGLLMLYGLPLLMATVLGFAPLWGKWGYNFALFLDTPHGMWIYQIVASAIVMIVPFWLSTVFYRQKLGEVVMVSAPEKKSGWGALLCIGLGGCVICNVMASFVESLINYEDTSIQEAVTGFPTDPLGVFLVILAVSITPALVEEFAFRGVCLGLLRNVSDGFALFVSSLFFGLMHGNFSQAPASVIMGLFFGFVALKSGSIWPSVILHFLNNGISVLLTYLGFYLPVQMYAFVYFLIFVIMLLLGVLGFILYVKKRDDAFAMRKAENKKRSGSGRFWIFMGTPCMIVYTVLIILEIIAAEIVI